MSDQSADYITQGVDVLVPQKSNHHCPVLNKLPWIILQISDLYKVIMDKAKEYSAYSTTAYATNYVFNW